MAGLISLETLAGIAVFERLLATVKAGRKWAEQMGEREMCI
jgi:hypothetical protein